jgi:hypothetical protein
LIWEDWAYFNSRFFGGKLSRPRAIRITSARKYDGYISYLVEVGTQNTPAYGRVKGQARICLSTHQTMQAMRGTLLHEMVHQYQLEVLRIEPDHGPVFRTMCKWIERETRFQLRVNRLA